MKPEGSRRSRPFCCVVALALAGCGRDGPQFRASDVTGSAFGRDFALTDHNGKARTLADFRGKVVVLFFGYTQCPDVCPTTLATLAEAKRRLGPGCRQGPGAVRDGRSGARHGGAPVALRDGVRSVVPGPVRRCRRDGAHREGVQDHLPEAARAGLPRRYTMDHSAGTFVFDQRGPPAAVRRATARTPNSSRTICASSSAREVLRRQLPCGHLAQPAHSRSRRRLAGFGRSISSIL